jgi:hypothetical protein
MTAADLACGVTSRRLSFRNAASYHRAIPLNRAEATK